MKVRILGAASRDLIDGYRFYERQAAGVGNYFIDSLVISAGIHALHFGRYRRLLAKRFPFAIYYRVEGDTALVYAVLDCRRSPAWTRLRLT